MENQLMRVYWNIELFFSVLFCFRFILKFKGSHLNQDALSMDKKLAVLWWVIDKIFWLVSEAIEIQKVLNESSQVV